MSSVPETRASLLLRLRQPADEAAWREFLEIYQPLIHRLLRRQGLQEADAEDVTQQALLAVMSAIGRWEFRPETGSFRAWLFTIARNLMINFVSRGRNASIGGTSFVELLEQQPADDEPSRLIVQREYEAEVFRWAAAHVRLEVEPTSWYAFWRTAVDGEAIPDVAQSLGLSLGAVYAARSRIMARLKRKATDLIRETDVRDT